MEPYRRPSQRNRRPLWNPDEPAVPWYYYAWYLIFGAVCWLIGVFMGSRD